MTDPAVSRALAVKADLELSRGKVKRLKADLSYRLRTFDAKQRAEYDRKSQSKAKRQDDDVEILGYQEFWKRKGMGILDADGHPVSGEEFDRCMDAYYAYLEEIKQKML